MELMDVFSKYDTQLDASCKRNEKIYFEMSKVLNKPANLVIEVNTAGRRAGTQQVSVEEYIKNFKWDQIKFQMDKSLKVIGAKIAGNQKTCDDRLKKVLDEQTTIKNKLGALQKKDSTSFMQKDLGDIVYEKKISKNLFVNTHGSELMTTVLIVVNKKKVQQFKDVY